VHQFGANVSAKQAGHERILADDTLAGCPVFGQNVGQERQGELSMRAISTSVLLALGATGLAACGSGQNAEQSTAAVQPAQPATPYKPVATVLDLMRSMIEIPAEIYWESVSVVVDIEGTHENMPQTELEWIEVWAAAMTLAETGNLLMMPPRAVDNDEWIRMSTDLVDVSLKAAQMASDRDFEGMLAVGEEIYNVCLECHQTYVPTLADL
jgi:hypothetical protein